LGNYLLKPGLNTLVITMRDGLGNVLGTTTLQVNWIELLNPTNAPVNLTDWRVSDNNMTFVIPAGYSIPAGGRLLIWADDEVAQNTGSDDLHANFQLSASGETVSLRAPDTTLIDSVSYSKVETDESLGRCPDGSVEFAIQTLPTPLGANVVTRFSSLTRTGNVVSFSFTTTPGYRYLGEWSGDLTGWQPMGSFSTAGGTSLSLEDPAATSSKRFYRVRVSD
jgi:hypothetical protein